MTQNKNVKTVEKRKYIYNGPIYRFDRIVVQQWVAMTYAVSKAQAINQLRYQARQYLKLVPNTQVYVDETKLQAL